LSDLVAVHFGVIEGDFHHIVRTARWIAQKLEQYNRYGSHPTVVAEEALKLLKRLEEVARSIGASDLKKLARELKYDVDPASTGCARNIISRTFEATESLTLLSDALQSDPWRTRLAAVLHSGMIRIYGLVHLIAQELEPIAQTKADLDFGSPE
jgi:hypothetical protein